MVQVTASLARQTLPEQLDRVAAGEEVAITRHGRVVAVLVSPETLRTRRAPQAWIAADQLADRLEAARAKPLPPRSLDADSAERLAAAVTSERRAR